MPALIYWGFGAFLLILVLGLVGLGVAMMAILAGAWCLLGLPVIGAGLFVGRLLWKGIIKPSLGGNGPGVNSGS